MGQADQSSPEQAQARLCSGRTGLLGAGGGGDVQGPPAGMASCTMSPAERAAGVVLEGFNVFFLIVRIMQTDYGKIRNYTMIKKKGKMTQKLTIMF